MAGFSFKHQEAVEELLQQKCTCPPLDLSPSSQCKAYRFVFEECDERSFAPQAVSRPGICKGKSSETCCQFFSLSLYLNAEGAKEAYAFFQRHSKKFALRVGSHLAVGELAVGDGLMSAPDKATSHFEMYEADNIFISNKFRVVEQLP